MLSPFIPVPWSTPTVVIQVLHAMSVEPAFHINRRPRPPVLCTTTADELLPAILVPDIDSVKLVL